MPLRLSIILLVEYSFIFHNAKTHILLFNKVQHTHRLIPSYYFSVQFTHVRQLNPDASGSVVTGRTTGQSGFSSQREKKFQSPPQRSDRLWRPPSPTQTFPYSILTRRQAEGSQTSSVWSYTCTPLYACKALRFIRGKDNVNFKPLHCPFPCYVHDGVEESNRAAAMQLFQISTGKPT